MSALAVIREKREQIMHLLLEIKKKVIMDAFPTQLFITYLWINIIYCLE